MEQEVKQRDMEIELLLLVVSHHLDGTTEAAKDIHLRAMLPFCSVSQDDLKYFEMAHSWSNGEEIDCKVQLVACDPSDYLLYEEGKNNAQHDRPIRRRQRQFRGRHPFSQDIGWTRPHVLFLASVQLLLQGFYTAEEGNAFHG